MFILLRNELNTSLNKLYTNYQTVRYVRLRKPPWEPRAKSKMFRVPPLKQKDPEISNYMDPIWRNYKAQMRSIYQVFKTVYKFTDKESLKALEEERLKEEKENTLFELNDKINKEILERQLQNEELKLNEKKEQIEYELNRKLEIENNYRNLANMKVKQLKEKAKSFIDPNNLEYEIEKMLNERYDYNFSIDTSGRIYKDGISVTKPQAFDTKYKPEINKAKISNTS